MGPLLKKNRSLCIKKMALLKTDLVSGKDEKTRMRKKLLTLLLALSLLLSMCPAALAAEDGGVRVTSFFTGQAHADVDFDSMEYRHIDGEPFLQEIEAVRALLNDGANAEEVEERFLALAAQFMEVATMSNLIYIRVQQDVSDAYACSESEYIAGLWDLLADALSALEKDILESGCSAFLDEALSEAARAYYLAYVPKTEEELSMTARETALVNEYLSAACQTFTCEYGGTVWDSAAANDAYLSQELDDETYDVISRGIAQNQNAVLGDIYMRMVELRQQIARAAGYDNYAEYAYSEIYARDYSLDEVREFHSAVKEYIMPLYCAAYDLYLADYYGGAYNDLYADYGGDAALDMMEPYIARMSSELLESFAYMRIHGLYDSGYSESKSGAGFTTMLYSYGAPFFFNSATAYGDPYDFTTAVHEFGHYNSYYWQPVGWEDGSKNIDLSEVHSQGLELIFSHWYADIFGEEDGETLLNYQIFNMLHAIYTGAIYDELQLYVYTTEGVTLDMINREWRRLCAEYGTIPADDPREEMLGWVDVHHTFDVPCYYISYAVSAAGAFSFWLEAQEGDYFDAVDHYLEFTALDAAPSFQESFELVDMESPISPAYLEDLADALWEALDVDARLAALPPEDLTGMEWFAPEAYALLAGGMIEKDGNNCIRPYDRAVWDDAADLMEHLTGERPAAEHGSAPMTRLEFVRLLADSLELEDGTESPFSDTDDGAVAALAELGVITGYTGGAFLPGQSISRGEMWVIVYRMLTVYAIQLLEGAAA